MQRHLLLRRSGGACFATTFEALTKIFIKILEKTVGICYTEHKNVTAPKGGFYGIRAKTCGLSDPYG